MRRMVAPGRLVLAMRVRVIALEAYEQGLHGRHRYAELRSPDCASQQIPCSADKIPCSVKKIPCSFA